MPVRFFCNIGWMKNYRGLVDTTDSIIGGGTHIDEHEWGGEICNFVSHRGYVYGYVQQPKGRRPDGQPRDIKLERLGASEDAERIDDITVVWTAKRPGMGRVVIGWYNNATVYRYNQPFPGRVPPIQRKNGLSEYNIRARTSDVKLLHVEQRVVPVRSHEPDWFGQSPIWYADTKEARRNANGLVADVRAFVRGTLRPARRLGRRGVIDQALKVQIEEAAVDHVWKYYEGLGYDVRSVERLNLGWDLVAALDGNELNIEVKGLTAQDATIELTPNETREFHRAALNYRLCVVRSPLARPKLQVFAYDEVQDEFVDQIQGALYLDPKIRESVSLTATLYD